MSSFIVSRTDVLITRLFWCTKARLTLSTPKLLWWIEPRPCGHPQLWNQGPVNFRIYLKVCYAMLLRCSEVISARRCRYVQISSWHCLAELSTSLSDLVCPKTKVGLLISGDLLWRLGPLSRACERRHEPCSGYAGSEDGARIFSSGITLFVRSVRQLVLLLVYRMPSSWSSWYASSGSADWVILSNNGRQSSIGWSWNSIYCY